MVIKLTLTAVFSLIITQHTQKEQLNTNKYISKDPFSTRRRFQNIKLALSGDVFIGSHVSLGRSGEPKSLLRPIFFIQL